MLTGETSLKLCMKWTTTFQQRKCTGSMYHPELLLISYTVIVSDKLMPNQDIISFTSEKSVPIIRINTSYKKYSGNTTIMFYS